MSEIDLDELRSELSEFAEPEKKGGRSPREERIIAGFEEVQRFVEKQGRLPKHGEDLDIFERLYSVRLQRMRESDECRALLMPLDHQGLLRGAEVDAKDSEVGVSEDELLAELKEVVGGDGIMNLRHVRKSADKRAAEEIANRDVCSDFGAFQPLFEEVRKELDAGVRKSIPVRAMDQLKLTEIHEGQFFIVGGQLAYIAEVGEQFRTGYERRDSRLRVIYDNGTESNLLMRSFQRALYPDKDQAGRIISNPSAGPLFTEEHDENDLASGTIYVLRSKSDHPLVVKNKSVLHKIGVTGGRLETRIANAILDPTFLMAEVEIVATYQLFNISRVRLENIIHRVFDAAQLDIEISDRFGNPVRPREWFLVPLFVVDEVVGRIKDGTIVEYVYDPGSARLAKATDQP